MNRKIILSISLIVLVGLTVFISASMSLFDESNNKLQYVVEINLYKGWNLIPAMCNSGTNEIADANIQTLFAYDKNKYLNVYHNNKFQNEDKLVENEESICSGSWWAYATEDSEVNYKTDYMKKIKERQLTNGWNFLIITPEMASIMFNQKTITGNCNIEKSYFFNPENQNWVSYPVDNLIQEIDGPDDEDFIGLAWVIKVSNDCTLGSSTGETSPPGLPGSNDAGCVDPDGGLNYYAKSGVSIDGVIVKTDLCEGDYIEEALCFNEDNYAVDTFFCPNGCENGKCYYPGYNMATDKTSYSSDEEISLTLTKGDDGKIANVDVYIDDTRIMRRLTIENSRTIKIDISEYNVFDKSSEYMILLCDGNAECFGGWNTNSIIVDVII